MTDPISDATLDELLRLEAEATPGEWVARPALSRSDGAFDCALVTRVDGLPRVIAETFGRVARGVILDASSNALLLAALRNHARALLLELRELRAEVEARRECVELRAQLVRLEGES